MQSLIYRLVAGPVYFEESNARIGIKMMLKKSRPNPNPVLFPNDFAKSKIIIGTYKQQSHKHLRQGTGTYKQQSLRLLSLNRRDIYSSLSKVSYSGVQPFVTFFHLVFITSFCIYPFSPILRPYIKTFISISLRLCAYINFPILPFISWPLIKQAGHTVSPYL